MKERDFKKILITTTLILCLVSAIYLGVFYVERSGEIRIMDGKESPYTVEQVETMMKYHGAVVAKFEHGHWLFLKDGNWIAIENGNALEFALRSSQTGSPSL